MSVTRDKRNGTWYVQAWYKTYDGKRAHKVKRGFKTKPEALAWERDFYAVQAGDMDMKLVDFLELYKKDMGPRLRLNTWKTKESIIRKRVLPYLGEKRMSQIAPVDIVRWQNELMSFEKPGGGGFSATYLKTVNNQLCALFNHAVRFYGLLSNPCRRAESMGSKSAGEMRFWTKVPPKKAGASSHDHSTRCACPYHVPISPGIIAPVWRAASFVEVGRRLIRTAAEPSEVTFVDHLLKTGRLTSL